MAAMSVYQATRVAEFMFKNNSGALTPPGNNLLFPVAAGT